MRILITGAGGFIGSRLAHRAIAEGATVRTLTRREWSGAPFVPERERFFGELPFDIPGMLFEDVDIVVHCAASADPRHRRARAINVAGSVRLAEAARDAGAHTFIMLSSQSAHADAPAAYGRSKYEAERALETIAGLGVTILRPGLVCGRGGLFGRILRSVERAPVVPLVGAEAPVQPLFVGDLLDAILRIAQTPHEFGGVLQLGTSSTIPLGLLISLIAQRCAPSPRLLPNVPTGALAVVVRAAERMSIPLPINSSNIAGMRSVRVMDTRRDMQRLGLPDRNAAEIVTLAMHDALPHTPAAPDPRPGVDRPSDTLLVGAGRIGLVHAITLSRLPGAVLAGVADRSPAARRLLASTGVRAAPYAELDDALASRNFDAVVLATPPSSHLSLARECANRGLATLIEKPACVGPAQIPAFEQLAASSKVPILVGYLMPGMPHLADWFDRIRGGDLGRVLGFEGFSLLSLMREPSSQRWETRREISGGGVLANSAGHVLSLIREAFGAPSRVRSETRRIVSSEVEDAAVVQFDFPTFSGTHYSSWCIDGYPRQENRLVVKTERGRLFVTISVASFVNTDGSIEMNHQLDYDVGFNLAPDYAGGGIARELNDLSGRAVDGFTGREMSLRKALGVERLLFDAYATAADVREFTAHDRVIGDASSDDESALAQPRGTRSPRILDLRDLDVESRDLASVSQDDWPEVAIYSAGLSATRTHWPPASTRITVPNLLQHTRLIGDRRYLQLAQSLGPRGLAASARHAATAALRERNAGFWVAVSGLLAAELVALPPRFDGVLLLHPYVVDLALSLDALDRLDALVGMMRRERPRASVGLHSNLASAAANALTMLEHPVDRLSLLTSPNSAPVSGQIRGWLDSELSVSAVRLTAEVGPAPLHIHKLAYREPERWLHGADALLISGMADGRLFERLAPAVRRRWAASFGTLPLPDAAW